MQFKFSYALVLLVALIMLVSTKSEAILRVNITQGNSQKIPIAVKICDGSSNGLWNEISSIIKSDLDNSGIINVVNESTAYVACDSSASITSWDDKLGKGKTAFLLSIYANDNDGKIEVKFRLFDVLAELQLVAKAFSASIKEHRRVAHVIADSIYSKLTGDSGYFDTKILYIAEHARKKRVAIMDQDGANNNFITSGEHLTLTPRFSPDNRKVVYTLYLDNQAKVYYHNIITGDKKIVGDFSGVISAPRFSPDGKSVILARSINGETDIYSINLHTEKRKKLTVKSSINTSPSYSPDQKKIVFNSDRSGTPHIYVMDSDGNNQKRISRGIGAYMSPVWSPRGDLIAFTKVYNKHFYIGIMRADGSDERIIANGYLVESPSWAPNGRLIVFTKQGLLVKDGKRSTALHVVDVMGFNERVIKTEHNASEPSWSSIL